jgi:hypothetical protein
MATSSQRAGCAIMTNNKGIRSSFPKFFRSLLVEFQISRLDERPMKCR